MLKSTPGRPTETRLISPCSVIKDSTDSTIEYMRWERDDENEVYIEKIVDDGAGSTEIYHAVGLWAERESITGWE